MDFISGHEGRTDEIIGLFTETFSAAEGAEEGHLIGTLVTQLLHTTPTAELFVFSAQEDGQPVGCIVFTRLVFEQDTRQVFLLSPVAVAPDWQRRGVGQALLKHGLSEIAKRGADVAITYGDPRYYSRVGFHPITAEDAPPPFPLSQPEGWIAQSLTCAPLVPLKGPSRCVEALSDPAYW